MYIYIFIYPTIPHENKKQPYKLHISNKEMRGIQHNTFYLSSVTIFLYNTLEVTTINFLRNTSITGNSSNYKNVRQNTQY